MKRYDFGKSYTYDFYSYCEKSHLALNLLTLLCILSLCIGRKKCSINLFSEKYYNKGIKKKKYYQ